MVGTFLYSVTLFVFQYGDLNFVICFISAIMASFHFLYYFQNLHESEAQNNLNLEILYQLSCLVIFTLLIFSNRVGVSTFFYGFWISGFYALFKLFNRQKHSLNACRKHRLSLSVISNYVGPSLFSAFFTNYTMIYLRQNIFLLEGVNAVNNFINVQKIAGIVISPIVYWINIKMQKKLADMEKPKSIRVIKLAWLVSQCMNCIFLTCSYLFGIYSSIAVLNFNLVAQAEVNRSTASIFAQIVAVRGHAAKFFTIEFLYAFVLIFGIHLVDPMVGYYLASIAMLIVSSLGFIQGSRAHS